MKRYHYPMGVNPLPTELNEYLADFFLSESSREPGQDSYAEIFDSPLMFPLQRRRETERMMQIARSYSPKVVYEIGADKGGGLYHWCKCLPSVKRVICCEIRGTPYSALFEQAFSEIDFLWLPESSYAPEGVAKVRNWLGDDKIGALFIDGDKCRFHTDFDVYLPLMIRPGVVFMHDIQDESTGNSYKEVIGRGYNHQDIIDKTESEEAVARQKQEIPSSSVHEEWLRHWYGRSAGVGVIYLDS